MLTIPFRLRRGANDPATFVYTVDEVSGLIGLEEDGLVLQYREKTSQSSWPARAPTESDLRVLHIPLGALRRAELRRGWFHTRLVLAAADLRAFEPFRTWLKGSELALSTRLLSHGG